MFFLYPHQRNVFDAIDIGHAQLFVQNPSMCLLNYGVETVEVTSHRELKNQLDKHKPQAAQAKVNAALGVLE